MLAAESECRGRNFVNRVSFIGLRDYIVPHVLCWNFSGLGPLTVSKFSINLKDSCVQEEMVQV